MVQQLSRVEIPSFSPLRETHFSPSAMNRAEMQELADQLAASYRTDLRAHAFGLLLSRLTVAASRDPGFASEEARNDWILELFRIVVEAAVDDNQKKAAMFASAPSLVSSILEIARGEEIQIEGVLPIAWPRNLNEMKALFNHELLNALAGEYKYQLRRNNPVPFLHFVLQIAPKEEEIGLGSLIELVNWATEEVYKKTFPLRHVDGDELAGFQSLQAITHPIIAALRSARHIVL